MSTMGPEPSGVAARLVGARLVQLELEHEAVWLLGVVGGRESGLRDRVADELERHLQQRDRLLASLDVADVDAGVPRASYGVPPADESAARIAIADVERRLSAACLAVVPLLEPSERATAVEALTDAARAAVRWGEAPRAFPGLD